VVTKFIKLIRYLRANPSGILLSTYTCIKLTYYTKTMFVLLHAGLYSGFKQKTSLF